MWRRLLIGSLVLASVAAIAASMGLALWRFESSPSGTTPGEQLISALPALGWTAAGAVLATLRPRNAVGWIFLGCGVLLSAAELLHSSLPWYGFSSADATRLWQLRPDAVLRFVPWISVPTVVLALYPDGRLPASWWRWPTGAAVAGIAVVSGALFLPFTGGSPWRHPAAVAGALLIAAATATIFIGTFLRWRRGAYPYRQQLSWFLGSLVLSYAGALALAAARVRADSPQTIDAIRPLVDPMLIVPIGVAIGVLRYRLMGFKTVLRRGLVYAALTILVFTVYLVVTTALSRMLDGRPLPGVVAAAVVAVCLVPARDRLQRAADRLVYGARRDPLRALAELSDTGAEAHLELVPAAVASVAAAVHADGAAIVAPDGKILARAGEEPARYLALPLRFAGAGIGELRVAEPAGGERYSEADIRLLTALAAQLAVVVSAAELTEALEAERNRVVTATRDERDRLRRDLHDGLGPSLTGVSLGLQALAGLVGDATTPAGALVHRLRSGTDTAVHDIRRIIDGLRPTALDTAGLTQAVESHAGTLHSTLPVDVTADRLPVLAPDVEVAAYRIITEALTNAARHAHARHAQVTISADEALHIAVSDDGHGIHPDAGIAGVGLASMRSRAEALGGGLAVSSTAGGTVVSATLPLSSSHRS